MPENSHPDRIDSFEEKLRLLQDAWKRGDHDVARSLTHSLRDSAIQAQIDQAQKNLEDVQQSIVAKHEDAHAVSVKIEEEIGAVQVELEGIEAKKAEAMNELSGVQQEIAQAQEELNQLKLAQQKARNATTIALNEIQTVRDQALIEIAKQAKQKNVKLNKELLQGILTE